MREASPTASSILGSITLLWKSRKSSIFPSIWRTLHFRGEFSTRGFFLLQKLTLATRLWGRFLLLRAQQQLAPETKLKLFWLKLQEIWDQIARGILLMFSPKVTMITTILITSTTVTTILWIMMNSPPPTAWVCSLQARIECENRVEPNAFASCSRFFLFCDKYDDGDDWSYQWRIFTCRGCGNISPWFLRPMANILGKPW